MKLLEEENIEKQLQYYDDSFIIVGEDFDITDKLEEKDNVIVTDTLEEKVLEETNFKEEGSEGNLGSPEEKVLEKTNFKEEGSEGNLGSPEEKVLEETNFKEEGSEGNQGSPEETDGPMVHIVVDVVTTLFDVSNAPETPIDTIKNMEENIAIHPLNITSSKRKEINKKKKEKRRSKKEQIEGEE